jgi:hypothetical protein
MLKRHLGILFLVICLNLTTVPPVLGGENSRVVNVAGDGSGDFNCDGNNDHVQINQALDYAANHPGTTVHLKGPFTYVIGESLLIGSNTVLQGDSGVTIKLAPGLPVWGGPGSDISGSKAMLMIRGNSAAGVTIRSLTVDGSQSDYYSGIRLGTSCYNMATLIGVNGLTIESCLFKNGCNDAVLISKSSNVLVDSVTVNYPGHAGVYAYDVNKITVKNCKFINRSSSSTRFDTVTNGVFADNYCTSHGFGDAGLQLEDKLTNIEVHGNKFHNLAGPAIAKENSNGKNIDISNNIIS